MELRTLGGTDLAIAPLVFGGNVFGWTVDKETSFQLLDAFFEAGFNAIDTADVYYRYAPGMTGGESETIIGEWMKDRGVRDRIVVITKGGLDMGTGFKGLGKDYLPKACEASLKRLQVETIDLYLSHRADGETPIEETLEAFQGLIDAGKIRHAGCSNYTRGELGEALAAPGEGRARYQVLQPKYNLVERAEYEGEIEPVIEKEGLGVIPYFGLASGFLTGKYRSLADAEGSKRAHGVKHYLDERGLKVLATLDAVAARHGATQAQVALAWLMARPSVTAPIASATSMKQLTDILRCAELSLDAEDMAAFG